MGCLSESYVSGSVGVQSSGGADPTLYSKKFLPIGYGNGGLPLRFQYPLGEGNVTILKLYFTSDPMDLKWLEQATPFADDPQDQRGMRKNEEAWRLLNASTPIVFTKTFTIVANIGRARH